MALDLHVHDNDTPTQLPAVTAPALAHRIHPGVYAIAAGLALLFIASAWTFVAPDRTYYSLAVVTGFIGLAVGLPYQLWRVRRHGHDPRDSSLSPRSLSNWLATDFDTWQERLKGSDAAIAILLPVAAVSIGLLCLAIVLHIDGH